MLMKVRLMSFVCSTSVSIYQNKVTMKVISFISQLLSPPNMVPVSIGNWESLLPQFIARLFFLLRHSPNLFESIVSPSYNFLWFDSIWKYVYYADTNMCMNVQNIRNAIEIKLWLIPFIPIPSIKKWVISFVIVAKYTFMYGYLQDVCGYSALLSIISGLRWKYK